MAASLLIHSPSLNTYEPSNHEDTYCYPNKMVYGSPKEIYQDITVVKALNKAKFPVYLVNSRVNKQNYAMKVFAHKIKQSTTYFKNEIRFACLQHPNVVRNLHIENEKETLSKGVITKVSYTIMEYAPYGDFFDFVMGRGKEFDDKLARTYFRHMIEGLEYLHNNGVSHMDIKLENLLLGKDFRLKITDFDLSHFQTDSKILSKGTRFYRSPELADGKCKNTNAVDIYAAGVVLFTFKTNGILPHSEDNLIAGTNYSELLYNNDPTFWTKHCLIQKKDLSFFDEDFRQLFLGMTKKNPEERITLQEVKKSKWYNGPVYSVEELKNVLEKALKC